jgi:hypothetical protein
MGLVDGFAQVDWAFAKEIFGMELKSPNKNIRIVGVAGVIAGIGLMSLGHSAFGTSILGGGVVFLLLPLFRTN